MPTDRRRLRLPILVAAVTGVFLPAAHAQAPAGGSPSAQPAPPTQLDRIEGKLDELLRRLPAAPATAPAVTASTPAVVVGANRAGALALARPVGPTERTLAEPAPDSVGGFVYTGGPLPLSNPASHPGIRYTGTVGYELQGWLQAKEAGRYQFGVDVTARTTALFVPTCLLEIWLEDRSLGQDRKPTPSAGRPVTTVSLILGADLTPGLYKFRAWIACAAQSNVATAAELLLKTPAELNLRPLRGSDLLHRDE